MIPYKFHLHKISLNILLITFENESLKIVIFEISILDVVQNFANNKNKPEPKTEIIIVIINFTKFFLLIKKSIPIIRNPITPIAIFIINTFSIIFGI